MSEQDPKAVAQSQGTRVWNQWDDETAKEIADVAAEQAEAEGDDARLAEIRALSPDDNPDVAEHVEDLDHADPHVARTTLNDPPVVETVDAPPAPKPKTKRSTPKK